MKIPTPAEFVAHCEAFCARFDLAETTFGRRATGEPQLLASIRGGRSPSLNVLNRVASFMAEIEAASAAEPQPATEWPIEAPGNGGGISGLSGGQSGGAVPEGAAEGPRGEVSGTERNAA